MAETPEITAIKSAVQNRFGSLPDFGTDNCRKIKGKDTWSQHAWGNAWDIGVKGAGNQKPIVDFLQTIPQAGTILWTANDPSPPDHSDHIHVEGASKKSGTPPCAGGKDSGGSAAVLENCKLQDPQGRETAGGVEYTWLCTTSDTGASRTVTREGDHANEPVDPSGEPVDDSPIDTAVENPLNALREWGPKVLITLAGGGLLLVGAAFVASDLMGTDIGKLAKLGMKIK